MHPKKTLLLLFCTLCAATAAAQPVAVRFRVADRATRDAVVGAVAELRSRTDTAAARTPRPRLSTPPRTSTAGDSSPACRAANTA